MSQAERIDHFLKQAVRQLTDAGIQTARLDCLVLLEDATKKDRAWLLAHPEHALPAPEVTHLRSQLARRARHEPLAYIRGKSEFYGREFSVDPHTLVPRPETETIIELLKHVSRLESDITSWEDGGKKRSSRRRQSPNATPPASSLVHTSEGYRVVWEKQPSRRSRIAPSVHRTARLSSSDQNLHCIDIGTGSGAIAITAKLELPETTVSAIDIDEKCLHTARKNAETLKADISFMQGNLLAPIQNILDDKQVIILLCNLPYVPDNFEINTAASHEPRHALFGGSDGLDLYRELFEQVQHANVRPHYILTESLPPQHLVLADIALAAGFALTKTDDFIQLFEPH
jgi:methylase of polypeptide subunit release factors